MNDRRLNIAFKASDDNCFDGEKSPFLNQKHTAPVYFELITVLQ